MLGRSTRNHTGLLACFQKMAARRPNDPKRRCLLRWFDLCRIISRDYRDCGRLAKQGRSKQCAPTDRDGRLDCAGVCVGEPFDDLGICGSSLVLCGFETQSSGYLLVTFV
jgi:hypothetical protein